MSESETTAGPVVEPDAIKELLASGVKVSHGRLYIDWADEA